MLEGGRSVLIEGRFRAVVPISPQMSLAWRDKELSPLPRGVSGISIHHIKGDHRSDIGAIMG